MQLTIDELFRVVCLLDSFLRNIAAHVPGVGEVTTADKDLFFSFFVGARLDLHLARRGDGSSGYLLDRARARALRPHGQHGKLASCIFPSDDYIYFINIVMTI